MKKIIIIVAAILATVFLAVGVSAADLSVEASDGRIFEIDGTKFNLPSYVSPSGVKLVYDEANSVRYMSTEKSWVDFNSGDVLDLTPFLQETPSGQKTYVLTVNIDGSSKKLYFSFADYNHPWQGLYCRKQCQGHGNTSDYCQQ